MAQAKETEPDECDYPHCGEDCSSVGCGYYPQQVLRKGFEAEEAGIPSFGKNRLG